VYVTDVFVVVSANRVMAKRRSSLSHQISP